MGRIKGQLDAAHEVAQVTREGLKVVAESRVVTDGAIILALTRILADIAVESDRPKVVQDSIVAQLDSFVKSSTN